MYMNVQCVWMIFFFKSMAHVGTQFGGVHIYIYMYIYIYICNMYTYIYIWFCGYRAHRQKARCQTAGYRHFQCFWWCLMGLSQLIRSFNLGPTSLPITSLCHAFFVNETSPLRLTMTKAQAPNFGPSHPSIIQSYIIWKEGLTKRYFP